MEKHLLNSEFQVLSPYLAKSNNNLSLSGKYLIPNQPLSKKPLPLLKHYFVGPEIRKTIKHNLDWAAGKKSKPRFKFIYLMLPTICNQRCVGCFTGKDKGFLSEGLNGRMYSKKELHALVNFLIKHNGEAIIYGGGGELFTYRGAFDLIEQIISSGLGMVIFTNGSLLSEQDIKKIASMDVSLIISLRDTSEREHNKAVGIKGFRRTLKALEYALDEGMHKENRLAVEIPVKINNEKRVLNDFIPVMRSLGVIPLVEEFIQIMTSENEKKIGHCFLDAKSFFEKAREIDKKFGYQWSLDFGQRIIAQPKCERPLYSFAIYPSGNIMDCPNHSTKYGNFYRRPLREIIYSDHFKDSLLNFKLCACSVFYTKKNEVPADLPEYLKVFV